MAGAEDTGEPAYARVFPYMPGYSRICQDTLSYHAVRYDADGPAVTAHAHTLPLTPPPCGSQVQLL